MDVLQVSEDANLFLADLTQSLEQFEKIRVRSIFYTNLSEMFAAGITKIMIQHQATKKI